MSSYDTRTDFIVAKIEGLRESTHPGTTADAIYVVAESLIMIFDQLQAINGKLKDLERTDV